jgi:hypothetical protein
MRGASLKTTGKIWIVCPSCGFKSEKSLEWLSANSAFDCSICHDTVTVAGQMRTVKAPDEGSLIGRAFTQIGRSFGFGS